MDNYIIVDNLGITIFFKLMGTFKALMHIYSINNNKQKEIQNMRKTFNNALKVIRFRIEEERQEIKKAEADMKKFEYGSDEYTMARVNFKSSIRWKSCLEYLLETDLSDFNIKYFDELTEHKNKFTD